MAFKMKYKNLKEVVKQLNSAVVAHGKQAKTINKHIDEMEDSPMKKKRGLDGIKTCWKKKNYKLVQGTKKRKAGQYRGAPVGERL